MLRFTENVPATLVMALVVPLLLLGSACSRGRSSHQAPGVVESFTDPGTQDPGATTAAWSLDGSPGLHATFGFGGNGADGALVVTGNMVLDSSGTLAAAPGPDGLVEWNFTRLTVEKGATLRLTGAYPIRLKVMGTCAVQGTLDASGANGGNGPVGKASVVGTIAGGAGGPGGGAGGPANTNPNFSIGSLPMDLRGAAGFPRVQARCGELNRSANRLITVIENNCGGGTGGNRGLPALDQLRNGCSGNGGGHASDGRMSDLLCQNLMAFGRESGLLWVIADGTAQVTAPTAGSGGGGGGNAAITTGTPSPKDDIVAGSGGGGGGGVEIECAGAVTVAAGGAILADGGHGGMGFSTIVRSSTVRGGYGAGGAGGSIWLSATSVVVETGGIVSARGGIGNPAPPQATRSGKGGRGYTILRDLGGTPLIEGGVAPTPPSTRYSYSPPENGTSQAVSTWYDGVSPRPRWAFNASDSVTGEVRPGTDLVFANPPAAGQTVHIDFQVAPHKDGSPDPDPTTWYPAGNTAQDPHAAWETDLTRIPATGDHRWLRFRIRFNIGKLSKSAPVPNQTVVRSVRIWK